VFEAIRRLQKLGLPLILRLVLQGFLQNPLLPVQSVDGVHQILLFLVKILRFLSPDFFLLGFFLFLLLHLLTEVLNGGLESLNVLSRGGNLLVLGSLLLFVVLNVPFQFPVGLVAELDLLSVGLLLLFLLLSHFILHALEQLDDFSHHIFRVLLLDAESPLLVQEGDNHLLKLPLHHSLLSSFSFPCYTTTLPKIN